MGELYCKKHKSTTKHKDTKESDLYCVFCLVDSLRTEIANLKETLRITEEARQHFSMCFDLHDKNVQRLKAEKAEADRLLDGNKTKAIFLNDEIIIPTCSYCDKELEFGASSCTNPDCPYVKYKAKQKGAGDEKTV